MIVAEDIYFDGEKYISARNAATRTKYVADYIGQLSRQGKIISKRVGNSWYVEELSLLKHLAKNGLTSKHHGLRSFVDKVNSWEKIGNADIYADGADLENSEPNPVLKSDEKAEEVNLSEPLFPPLKKDKSSEEIAIPKKEFKIENYEPITVQPEAVELVSHSISRSPFVTAELFSKFATLTLSVAIAFSGYQVMSGNVKISSLLPNQASLASVFSSQAENLSRSFKNNIARVSSLFEDSSSLSSGNNLVPSLVSASPAFSLGDNFSNFTIGELEKTLSKIGKRLNSKIKVAPYNFSFDVYERRILDYQKRLVIKREITNSPAQEGFSAAPFNEFAREFNQLRNLLKLGASQIAALFSDTIDRFANFLSAGIGIVSTTIVPPKESADRQDEPSLAAEIARVPGPKKEIAALKPQSITVSGPTTQNVIERIIERTVSSSGASGASQNDLNKLENSLKSEIYRVASTASSQNAATYQVASLSNRINQLANLAISGATITSSTFTGEISATTGGFSSTLSVVGATTLSSTLNVTGATTLSTLTSGTTTLANLLVTGSTTLQNFTFLNATGTSATTTNFFATTASSTNLYASNLSIANLSGFLKATAGVVSTALVNLTSDITGILGVANGGTGWANLQSNTILLGNGAGAIATTTQGTNGQVLTLSSGIPSWVSTTTFSTGLTYAGGAVTCNTASGSVFGCLASADWTIFNNKVATTRAINTTYPLQGGGDLSSDRAFSLAFGTTSANTWSALQQFTNNASTTLLSVYNNAYFGATATSSFSSAGALTLASALGVGSGGTGLTSYTLGDILYASGAGTLAGTSTPNLKSTLALNLVENTALSTWAGSTNLTTLGTIATGVWSGTSIADAKIDDNITLTNITQITNRAISDTTGTLTVGRGGTGQTSFGQGWLHSDGTTLTSSTSPTVNYITATSTTATSTFAAGLQTTALNITGTATSTFASGINLTSGCFAISGACALTLATGLVAGDLDSQKNITLQSLKSASSTEQATTTILIDGIADSFSNTSGIDTANSSNLVTSTAGQVSPTVPTSTQGTTTYTSSGTYVVPSGVISVDYLVVGGGGGGESGTGGGAGGFRTAAGFPVTSGANYTVTVGTGGASGIKGGDSVFSTITSIGGGGGNVAAGGGSGGGGQRSSGEARTGKPGTAGQGNNGGDGAANNSDGGGGGGGGGASAVGANAPSALVGGNGGNGTASLISGSSVTYAGGGGGGGGTGGSGGSGGGGAGGTNSATAGTANTGGGGGGWRRTDSNTSSGESGGSGIVILASTTPITNITLLSRAFTATSTPSSARLAIQAASTASFTLNTDLRAAVSRDGGTTWATSTLVMMGTPLEDGTTLYGDSNIDVSTQPSGTSMKYRVLTANSKAITIYGVVFQWGAVTALSAANLTVSSALTVSGASTFSSTATTTFGGPISSASGNFIIGSAGTTNNLLLNPYGGNVGIGTTSPGYKLDVNGNLGVNTIYVAAANKIFQSRNDATLEYAQEYNRNGSRIGGIYLDSSTVQYITSSDVRLKDNIQNLQGAISLVRSIKPRTFNWKTTGLNDIGFVAQELETVFPQAVTKTTNPDDLKGVDYGRITPLLAGAINDITSVIDLTNATTTFASMYIDGAGNIGIGTTTPAYKLQVMGDVAATGFVNTSTRDSKTGITYLTSDEASTTLAKLELLKIATYRYKIDPLVPSGVEGLRLGLIAEDAQLVAPEILSVDGKGVDLYKLATFTLSGVQAQQRVIQTFASTTTALGFRLDDIINLAVEPPSETAASTSLGAGTSTPGSLVGEFLKNLFARVTTWLADTANGIGDFFAGRVHTKELCVFDASGETCVTRARLDALLASVAASTTPSISYLADLAVEPPSSGPTISITGNNPALITVGDIYGDLGAFITGPTDADKNLGIYASVDGGATTTPDQIVIDTSLAATHTILYSATDQAGNTGTAMRTVIVENTASTTSTTTSTTTPTI